MGKYTEIIEEGLNHPETIDMAEEAKEHKKLGHCVKTLVNQIKEKLKEIEK